MAAHKYALITGGSLGIGLELAGLFARDGYHLLLVALPDANLDAAANRLRADFPDIEVHTLGLDLSEDGAARQVYDWTRDKGRTPEVLVNNAGFGTYGFVPEIDPEREAAMIRLHVLSLYQLTRLFLKDMVAQDRGRILNLSSISGFQPNPFLATYGATKSFVLQFSRALNYELREKGSRVRVTVACPTPVKDTGFQAAAGMLQTNTFDSWMTVGPDMVAQEIYRASRAGAELIIPGRTYRMVHWFTRLLPTPWIAHISRLHLKTRKA